MVNTDFIRKASGQLLHNNIRNTLVCSHSTWPSEQRPRFKTDLFLPAKRLAEATRFTSSNHKNVVGQKFFLNETLRVNLVEQSSPATEGVRGK
jgi:hypothetical protein